MRKLYAAFLVGFSILFTACEKDQLINPETQAPLLQGDYLVFGSASTECAGPDCDKLFLLQGSKLYPDDMPYFSEKLVFSSNTLSPDKYKLSEQLLSKFPKYLLKHRNKTIGCPDCRDKGNFFRN